MTDIPEPYIGPCGCRFDCHVIDGVNTLVVTACPKGLDCEWAQWVDGGYVARHRPHGDRVNLVGNSGPGGGQG